MKKHDKWLAASWWGYDSGIAINDLLTLTCVNLQGII